MRTLAFRNIRGHPVPGLLQCQQGQSCSPSRTSCPTGLLWTFGNNIFLLGVTRSGISKEMLMLILCIGLDTPPFPWAGGFGGDKHAKGTDSALEADTAGQPQVQRRDFVSISPSRGALDWSQERQAVSLLSTSHSLPLPSGSFFSGFVNSPLLQFEPPNTAVTTVGKSRTDFFFSSCSSTQDVQRYFPPASAFTTFISCHHKIPQSPLPKSPDSPKSSFWLKGSYLPSRALFQNPKRCGTF